MATSCIALSPSRLHVALHRRRPQPPRAPALRQSPAREAQKAKRPGLPVPLFPVRRPPAGMANVAHSPGQLQHEASASSLPRMQKGQAVSHAMQCMPPVPPPCRACRRDRRPAMQCMPPAPPPCRSCRRDRRPAMQCMLPGERCSLQRNAV
ncbi:hypothetical protein PVAP13_1NG486738 [Panicum virgatum]|uniref:Uncharacterized protein n=1 Tax=Panicum virgatum TaxID=38727 RepID=A0A8T0XAF1_PANVG|nr:hypothetical protein PVAP13_1NG486738 [Panicum virgatum]